MLLKYKYDVKMEHLQKVVLFSLKGSEITLADVIF